MPFDFAQGREPVERLGGTDSPQACPWVWSKGTVGWHGLAAGVSVGVVEGHGWVARTRRRRVRVCVVGGHGQSSAPRHARGGLSTSKAAQSVPPQHYPET